MLDIHTIKPLDYDAILKTAKETNAVVTVEDHSIHGGLGGAVTEAVSAECAAIIRRVGVNDSYGRSGKVPPLLEYYGLTAAHIAEEARKAVALKK